MAARVPRQTLNTMGYTQMCVGCGHAWQRPAQARGRYSRGVDLCPECGLEVRADLNGWMRAAIYRAAIVEAQWRLAQNDREGALRALAQVGH